MADNRSGTAICCSESNERIRQLNSVRHIIFGWDRFNSITWLLLLLFFCIWCIGFFNMYEPKSEDDHHDHHWNEKCMRKGDQYKKNREKCKYFIILLIFNKKSVFNNNCNKHMYAHIIKLLCTCIYLNSFVYLFFNLCFNKLAWSLHILLIEYMYNLIEIWLIIFIFLI